ncbi:hypothetical protein GBAR_LOCUS6666 [Geodia barretti]|uniref:Death domain-containing protein n=1 Tax=Geodia barretti TaxID=519541 RepID=A0AA35RG36_GEOBA|nr:hypothetical protein GBAR_LOCUS6666 [Geodia barretti]
MSRLWREGLGDVAEKEAMTQLLAALRKVMGYDERAQELAQSHGISLHLPQPPSTSSREVVTTANTFTANGATTIGGDQPSQTRPPTTSSPLTRHTDTPSTPLIVSSPLTCRHSSTVTEAPSSTVDGGGNSSSSISTLPLDNTAPFTQREQQVPKFRSQSPTLSSTSSTERSDDHHLLNSIIDMSLIKHKYAILDVCQRLPPSVSVMNDFAQRLNIPLDRVRQITNDSTMQEERYYQMLKFWLGEGGGGESKRTFMELRDALVSCQQLTASDIILRRLQSPGLTLRSPQVQRNSPQLVL